jgi:hypothetical protein
MSIVEWIKSAQRRVFRYETQFWYSDGQGPEMAEWLSTGTIVDIPGMPEWCTLVTNTTRCGVTIRRVRALSSPITDYLRWEMAVAQAINIPAGEDIRVIDATAPGRESLPADDFWIIDDTVVIVEFDSSHDMSGIECLSDSAHVAIYHDHMETAWTNSREWIDEPQWK